MINRKFTLILILLTFIVFNFNPDETKYHFYNEMNEPVEKVEFIYKDLQKYFKDNVPERITIKYIKTPIRIFDHDYSFARNDNTVMINEEAKSHLIWITAHESCHLCFFRIFKTKTGTREKYRFFNEGFCNIFASIAVNEYENIPLDQTEAYKMNVLIIAANENKKNNVSFKKVEKWTKYFGRIHMDKADERTNFYAYPVGSSFVYYILDTYGLESFFNFVNDLAKTDNMNRSFKNIFRKNKSEIEKEWLGYLQKVKIN